MGPSNSASLPRRWSSDPMLPSISVLVVFLFLQLCRANTITCVTSWGGGAGSTPIELPPDRINDGYCDCLDTAADETETDACAGVNNWDGLATTLETRKKTTPVAFQCPQQPDLQIHVSRVNDGICDCCDGADEKNDRSDCEDGCAAIFAAAEAARKALMDRYEKGSAQRAQSLTDFIKFQAETKTKLKQANHDLSTKQQKLSDTQTQLAAAKVEYYQKRVARLETATKTAAQSLTAGLSASELKWLIVHSCQMAGEMEGAEDGKTCVPLRLAALDAGIVWDGGEARSAEEANKVEVVADIFYHNSEENAKSIIWKESELDSNARKTKKKVHGRRLMRVVEADEYDDYPPDYDDYMYDYDGDEGEDDSDQPVHDGNTIKAENPAEEVPKDDENTAAILAELDKQPFMKMRESFSSKATELINAIDEALTMEEEKGGEEVVESEEVEDDMETAPQFDPIAYKMVRNTLDKRKRSLERGIGYGMSARFFLESLEQKLYDANALVHRLSLLAVGTLSYGKLSAPQYYEALASAVPELHYENDAQTCASPWSGICPPRALARDGVTIPSANILSEVEAFCAAELTKDPLSDGSCAAAATEQSSSKDTTIPSNVPDGYYGYYEVKGRADETVLAELFIDVGVAAKGDELTARLRLAELEEEEDRLEKDLSSLQTKVKDLENSIGIDDPDKFGPNGELHSLRDKCFEVEEGKYVYEVCLFGKAAQKDKGSSGAGTNLGKWTRATTETVTDDKNREYPQRVWYWENGAKCWNGPHRSATAYVTCGAETKVLSADEPDTCRYVLDMESPIACDDEFRERNGL